MIFHLDEPQADPAPINALFISRLARRHGIKVLLSGAGGDDVFTGYRRHYALMQEPYWSWLPKSVRSGMLFLMGGLPCLAFAIGIIAFSRFKLNRAENARIRREIDARTAAARAE